MNKYLVIILLLITWTSAFAQCPTDLQSGQNLVINGDFSQGYTGWQFDAPYIKFGTTSQTYSGPGYIYAGSSADYFNHDGFDDYPDHSSSGDNMMLMVDGICTSGVTLWSQTLTVSPNTNYYFSVWISSLKNNPNFPGNLDFRVNGTSLGTPVTAPLTGHVWDFFEATWNSGSTSGSVTITIANTTTQGCDTEVDFAIDDIAFIPGCAYGAIGPQPDLGQDRTLCGLGGSGILLDAGVPHNSTTIVTWVDSDGITTSGSGINAPYTLSATKPGTYSVCVSDNGSCTKSDVIIITNSFSVNLGPDIELCNPAAVTLDAGFTGVGVTYKWYKNYPTEADGDNRQKTYYVNTPGTYTVEVTDPSCGMQSSQIKITTKAPVAANAVYCNPGNVTLSVSPDNSGKYKWWTSPTSTDPADLATKGTSSYTFAAAPTNDYKFYVEDTASFRLTIGLPLTGNGLTNPQNRNVANETQLKFDVQTAITIDSIYIDLHVYNCPSQTIQLQVTDNLGNVVGTSPIFQGNATNGCVLGNSVIFKMPVGITVPVGTGYFIKLYGASQNMNWYQNGVTYPLPYSGVVSFTGNNTQGWANNAIPGMYRWVVTAGAACARVPVTATFKSCLPPPPVPDAHAGSDIVLCNTHTTTLSASLASGETGYWTVVSGYTATISPSTSPTASVTFAGDTARLIWNVTNVTGTSRDTVIVSTTIVQKPIITGPGTKCPGTTGVTFTANPDHTAAGSTYTWSVFQGDITMTSGETTYQLTADAGQQESIIELTETYNHCSSKNTDTIRMAPSNAVAQASADQHTCNTSVTLVGNEPLAGMGTGTWSLETLSPNILITSQTPYSILASNLELNTVYHFKYTIAGACGAPTVAYTKVTVGGGGFSISTVDQPTDTLCIGSQRDFTVHVSSGSGSYNYVWNKKGTTNLIQSATPKYSIVTSSLVEVYYVNVEDTKTNCSTGFDSVQVVSINYQHLKVPNLITPNGDNMNDVFKVVELNNNHNQMVAKNSEFIVYNSWGNEVFHANNYSNDWKANNISDGMYFYYLKAGCGGEEHKGWLQILGNVYK